MITKSTLIAAAIGAVVAVAITVPWVLLASRPHASQHPVTAAATPTAAVTTPPPATSPATTSPSPSPKRSISHRHHRHPARHPVTVYIYNCQGSAAAVPSSIVLACADAGISLGGLTWSGWGNATAYGSGQLSVNNCNPDCASGTFQSYPAQVTVTGLVAAPGYAHYTSLTVNSPGTAGFVSDTWPLGVNGPGS